MLNSFIRTLSNNGVNINGNSNTRSRSHSGSSNGGSSHGRSSIKPEENKLHTKFIEACRDGELSAAQTMYSDLSDSQRQELIRCRDANGVTPLMHAATNGRLEVAKWLVKTLRVDTNAQDLDGATALMRAAYWAQEEVIQFLVEEGQADCSIKNKRGKCALHIAYTSGTRSYLSDKMNLTNAVVAGH